MNISKFALDNPSLPYFDQIMNSFDDPDTEIMFSRNVHWGYWDNPEFAQITSKDFIDASDRLTDRFCNAANIKDGMRILDVGCGFGGLAIYLNKIFSNIKYCGINIDQRQLEIAKHQVHPEKNNTFEFVNADATNLPFSDASFDRVMALESIFHFPDREKFLLEAKRVLDISGTITCTDFIASENLKFFRSIVGLLFKDIEKQTWGNMNVISEQKYSELEDLLGLTRCSFEDMSPKVYPTYEIIRKKSVLSQNQSFLFINALIQLFAKIGMIKYHLYSWKLE